MPLYIRKSFLVIVRDNLFKWPEGKALLRANLHLVAKFLIENIICRYRIFRRLIINSGPKNKSIVKDLVKCLEFKRI